MSLHLNAITVRRDGRLILDEIDLAVAAGEVVAVLGPNGAGKSTLLAVAAGDLAPTGGTIRLGDDALTQLSGSALARRRAVLPQRDGLSFPFTVGEVVAMGRLPHADSATHSSNSQALSWALEETGMSGFSERIYTTLSGGERQRAQLARILAQIYDPSPNTARWLLLDEPSSALDLAHQQRLVGIIRRVAQQGIGVLVILHDPTLTAAAADRIVLLNQGRVLADGTPQAVLTPANLGLLYGLPIITMQDTRLKHLVVQPIYA